MESFMNRTALAPVLLLATVAATAQAQSFTDHARVRAVEPQYEVVQVPRQECTSQWVQEAPRAAAPAGGYGGAIIGGVAGGILGNQVGKGTGKEVATAAGAIVGAIAGDRIANSGPAYAAAPEAREMRSCRTVYDQQNRLTGYRVVYDYRGVEASTVMRDQPGATIPVRVSVTPMEADYRR
jgi:uncharacterized protein YcfJ